MAFRISVKVRMPDKLFASRPWAKQIAAAQRKETWPAVRKLYRQTVNGWSKKPEFGYVQQTTQSSIGIRIYPRGEHAELYNLVSVGSPRHDIPARRGGILRFRPGYRAATRPGQLMSRRAYRSGDYRTAKIVSHPGFDPRDFYELIGRTHKPQFKKDMQEAIAMAAQKK